MPVPGNILLHLFFRGHVSAAMSSLTLMHLAATTEGLHTGGYHRRLSPATHLQRLSPTIKHFAASIEGGESDVRHGHQTLALTPALTLTPTLPLTPTFSLM